MTNLIQFKWVTYETPDNEVNRETEEYGRRKGLREIANKMLSSIEPDKWYAICLESETTEKHMDEITHQVRLAIKQMG